jgi:hypothetical protein
MSFTQAHLDALNQAIASGELTIEYNGKKITYRSIGELVKAKQLVEAELSNTSRASNSIARFNR